MIQTTIGFLTVLCVSMGAICLLILTARVAPMLKIYLDENERLRKMLIKLEWSNAGRCPLCRQDWIVGHSHECEYFTRLDRTRKYGETKTD